MILACKTYFGMRNIFWLQSDGFRDIGQKIQKKSKRDASL